MIRPAELIPYAKHHVTPEDEAAVLEVLRSKWLTQGPKVEEFETLIATEAKARYAVAVSSGTLALELAVACIKNRDGINTAITSPISFVATANAIYQAGCRLAFVDVSPTCGWWSPATSAVHSDQPVIGVPVSLGGIAVNGTKLFASLPMVVDAAHSFGVASLGAADAMCFSFHAIKHVACGEGGAVVTNDEQLWHNLRMLRDHGRHSDRVCYKPGFNARMAEMPAALGCSQYTRLHDGIARRRAIAQHYDSVFGFAVEFVRHELDSARHLYCILVDRDRRTTIRQRLAEAMVGTQIHYPAIHLQPFYRSSCGFKEGDLPGAEEYAARTLSIPMYPSLTDAEVEYVATTVKRVVEECQ